MSRNTKASLWKLHQENYHKIQQKNNIIIIEFPAFSFLLFFLEFLYISAPISGAFPLAARCVFGMRIFLLFVALVSWGMSRKSEMEIDENWWISSTWNRSCEMISPSEQIEFCAKSSSLVLFVGEINIFSYIVSCNDFRLGESRGMGRIIFFSSLFQGEYFRKGWSKKFISELCCWLKIRLDKD